MPDLKLKVSIGEMKLLCLMLNQVMIASKSFRDVYLHYQRVKELAFSLLPELPPSQITLVVAVDETEKR